MKLRLTVIFTFISFCSLGITFCYGDSVELYFPLKEGITWKYSVISDKTETKKLIIKNLASRNVNDKKVFPQQWNAKGAIIYYLLAYDDYGVYRFAEQKTENSPPTITEPKLYHLRNPIGRGTTWDATTKLGEDKVNLNLTIESITESVKVPAGTFKYCIKVKQVGGGEKSEAGISITAYEWYGPNVGLVKGLVTIKKKSKDGKTSSENLTYQLDSVKR